MSPTAKRLSGVEVAFYLAKVRRVLSPRSGAELARWLRVPGATLELWNASELASLSLTQCRRLTLLSGIAELLDEHISSEEIERHVREMPLPFLKGHTLVDLLDAPGDKADKELRTGFTIIRAALVQRSSFYDKPARESTGEKLEIEALRGLFDSGSAGEAAAWRRSEEPQLLAEDKVLVKIVRKRNTPERYQSLKATTEPESPQPSAEVELQLLKELRNNLVERQDAKVEGELDGLEFAIALVDSTIMQKELEINASAVSV